MLIRLLYPRPLCDSGTTNPDLVSFTSITYDPEIVAEGLKSCEIATLPFDNPISFFSFSTKSAILPRTGSIASFIF